jgi:hypothetical protein
MARSAPQHGQIFQVRFVRALSLGPADDAVLTGMGVTHVHGMGRYVKSATLAAQAYVDSISAAHLPGHP